MDTRTGELKDLEELKGISKDMMEHFVGVDEKAMTEKQAEEKKVSLNDHISVLGKKLTKERERRGLTKNRYRRLKRQGKLR